MAASENGKTAHPERTAGQEASPKPAPDRRKWRYPDASEHPEQEIYVHFPWCKSCGICYSMCPQGVYESDKSGRPVVAHPEKCVACYLCEIMCPDMAITVHKVRRAKAAKAGSDAGSGEGGDE